MILKGKKVVIMGVRNKWSIAWGAAKSAYEQGAEVICTCAEENIEKVKTLLEELPEELSVSTSGLGSGCGLVAIQVFLSVISWPLASR